jgi:hypothetical protein
VYTNWSIRFVIASEEEAVLHVLKRASGRLHCIGIAASFIFVGANGYPRVGVGGLLIFFVQYILYVLYLLSSKVPKRWIGIWHSIF